MLSTQQLFFKVHQKNLLNNISFTLTPGRLYGLIGANGSGKSTLIKMLSGELTPTAGAVNYANVPLHQIPSKTLAKHIAYLPQHLPDAADFLVKELVMLGRFPWQSWLQKASQEDIDIVEQAMHYTAVTRFAHQAVNTLSGGERSRVWLSMCIAQQSEYLLLDEPLAALDIKYQIETMQLIRQLVDEKGLTVVIIIHDINLASQFCDELIALKQGHLIHQGSPTEIMHKETLKDIFNVEFSILIHPIHQHTVAVV